MFVMHSSALFLGIQCEAAGLGGPVWGNNRWKFFGTFQCKILHTGAFWTQKIAFTRL